MEDRETNEAVPGLDATLAFLAAGPMKPQSARTPEQLAAYRAALQRDYDTNVHVRGIFGTWTLSEADQCFLHTVRDDFFLATGSDLRFSGVLSGLVKHVNEVMSNGLAYQGQYTREQANPELVAYVERLMRERRPADPASDRRGT